MNDWEGLRTAAVIVAWITVAGGLIMAITWLALGGARAVGPEDELMARAGIAIDRRGRRHTALSSAQIGIHGLLGITTAGLLTYAAARSTDRPSGYLAVLAVAAITAVPGLLMFNTWRSSRPSPSRGDGRGSHESNVEHKLPTAVVYLHGLAAAGVIALVVVLLVVD